MSKNVVYDSFLNNGIIIKNDNICFIKFFII